MLLPALKRSQLRLAPRLRGNDEMLLRGNDSRVHRLRAGKGSFSLRTSCLYPRLGLTLLLVRVSSAAIVVEVTSLDRERID